MNLTSYNNAVTETHDGFRRGSAGLQDSYTVSDRKTRTESLSERRIGFNVISLGSAVTIYTWLSNCSLGIFVSLVEWVVTVWEVYLGQSV